MLGRLLTLAIVLAVAWWILKEATPLLQGIGGSTSPALSPTGGSEEADCVARAERANDRLVAAARAHAQPPVDVDDWSAVVWEIQSDIQTAQSVCICIAEACGAANEALDEMSSLLSNLDGMVRGDSPGFANPGHQQEQILGHLDRARSSLGF